MSNSSRSFFASVLSVNTMSLPSSSDMHEILRFSWQVEKLYPVIQAAQTPRSIRYIPINYDAYRIHVSHKLCGLKSCELVVHQDIAPENVVELSRGPPAIYGGMLLC